MNWDIIEGRWKQLTGNIQAQWGKLTDDDLDVIGGDRQKLEGRLQEHYGWTKEETERQVDTWAQDVSKQ